MHAERVNRPMLTFRHQTLLTCTTYVRVYDAPVSTGVLAKLRASAVAPGGRWHVSSVQRSRHAPMAQISILLFHRA